MMINVEIIFEQAKIHTDFLVSLSRTREERKLKFPKYNLSNRKFVRLLNKKRYFVLPYVILLDDSSVCNLLEEIKWCSDNFQGQFAMKYTTKRTMPNTDRLVIAFDNDEDKLLFLLRSDIGSCGYNAYW